MTIGAKVAEKRAEMGLTQEALANELGISTPYVSQIENDQKKPSYSLLIKIAGYFDVSIDHFFGEAKGTAKDPSVKFFEKALSTIDKEARHKVVSYLFQLCGVKRFEKIPFLNTPADYAKFLIKNYYKGHFPVDPREILSNLGVDVFTSQEHYEYEGILYKNAERPVIVLDPEVNNEKRIKFTLATLLGHLIIPWHLRNCYYREKGKRSSNEEDQQNMEARKFTDELLLPTELLKEDLRRLEPTLENLEKLAYEKYDCSLVALGHKFVEVSSKKYAIVTSEKEEITRKLEFNLPFELVGSVQTDSIVDDFSKHPPKKKEFRKGQVDPACWLKDNRNFTVHEETMLDPNVGVAVTLLKFTHK